MHADSLLQITLTNTTVHHLFIEWWLFCKSFLWSIGSNHRMRRAREIGPLDQQKRRCITQGDTRFFFRSAFTFGSSHVSTDTDNQTPAISSFGDGGFRIWRMIDFDPTQHSAHCPRVWIGRNPIPIRIFWPGWRILTYSYALLRILPEREQSSMGGPGRGVGADGTFASDGLKIAPMTGKLRRCIFRSNRSIGIPTVRRMEKKSRNRRKRTWDYSNRYLVREILFPFFCWRRKSYASLHMAGSVPIFGIFGQLDLFEWPIIIGRIDWPITYQLPDVIAAARSGRVWIQKNLKLTNVPPRFFFENYLFVYDF